jgi:hypothetical protein
MSVPDPESAHMDLLHPTVSRRSSITCNSWHPVPLRLAGASGSALVIGIHGACLYDRPIVKHTCDTRLLLGS